MYLSLSRRSRGAFKNIRPKSLERLAGVWLRVGYRMGTEFVAWRFLPLPEVWLSCGSGAPAGGMRTARDTAGEGTGGTRQASADEGTGGTKKASAEEGTGGTHTNTGCGNQSNPATFRICLKWPGRAASVLLS